MFTFFTRVPCPPSLTTTETLAHYFVTSPGNYAGQAAILNTIFPIESDRTLCQTLFKNRNDIERVLDAILKKFLKDSTFFISKIQIVRSYNAYSY